MKKARVMLLKDAEKLTLFVCSGCARQTIIESNRRFGMFFPCKILVNDLAQRWSRAKIQMVMSCQWYRWVKWSDCSGEGDLIRQRQQDYHQDVGQQPLFPALPELSQ